MAVSSGPEISNSGLIFNLDPANTVKVYAPSTVEVLVVAGGGGGGYEMGGGGGAGGVVYNSNFTLPAGPITVTVGAGGAGRTSNSDNTNSATNSVFGSITAYAGGAGGNNSYTYDGTNTGGRPMSGGSGGGSGEGQSVAPGVSGQGNSGGPAIESGIYHSGGGGGAGGAGQGGQAYGSGNGGVGILSFISGSSYYGGGGAGGNYQYTSVSLTRAGTGGAGGGGNSNLNSYGSNGAANTGGGGGGGSYSPSNNGGNGGSGIVIVRYPGPQRATGGTITQSGNNTIHTFTSSGTFLANAANLTSVLGDMSSSAVTATMIGSPTYSNGYISFNGSNQYMTAPMSALRPTNITMECWFYQNSTSGDQVLIGSQYGSSSGNSYALWKNGDTWMAGVNTTGSFAYMSTSYASFANTWYHFAYSYNGSTEKIFINGTEVASSSRSGSIVYDTNNTLLAICADWNGSGYDSGASVPLNGRLGLARLYNRGLSVAEVNNLYQASRDRFGV